MRFHYPVALLSILILAGCNNAAQQTQPNVYYDVAGFVNQQIADLSASKPVLKKEAMINAMDSKWESTHDVNWNRELELFIQADINKPALRSSYQIARPDSLTYQYTLKQSEERLTVRSLTVQLDSATRQPLQIKAVLQTGNPLYSSERNLSMTFGTTRDQRWRIRQYQVSGFQKLSYFDRNRFFVRGYIGPIPGELIQDPLTP